MNPPTIDRTLLFKRLYREKYVDNIKEKEFKEKEFKEKEFKEKEFKEKEFKEKEFKEKEFKEKEFKEKEFKEKEFKEKEFKEKEFKEKELEHNFKVLLPSRDYGIEKFTYKINEILILDKPKIKSEKLINICLFKIVERQDTPPTLLYLLNKDNKNNILYFPHFYGLNDLYNKSNEYLKIILKNVSYVSQLRGHIEYDKHIYIFYELNFRYQIENLQGTDIWWWSSIFEIVNLKTILNFNIDNSVSDLFINNPLLTSLFNENNNKIPSPEIVYLPTNSSLISFMITIGLPRSTSENILGPYYFFSTYNQTLNEILNGENKDKAVIVRLAIFTKKINYLLNHFSKNWTHGYNSVFIDYPQKSKPSHIDAIYLPEHSKKIKFGIKQYNQQSILSYHYVKNDNI